MVSQFDRVHLTLACLFDNAAGKLVLRFGRETVDGTRVP